MSEGSPVELENVAQEALFARDEDGKLIRFSKPTEGDLAETYEIQIDGVALTVPKAKVAEDALGNPIFNPDGSRKLRLTTILDAIHEAQTLGRDKKILLAPTPAPRVPVVCHQDHLTPVAVCRVCSVQVCKYSKRAGTSVPAPKLLPACQHPVLPDMQVYTMWAQHKPNPAAREVAANKGPETLQQYDKKDADERANMTRFRRKVRQSVQTLVELLASQHRNEQRDVEFKRVGKYWNELDDAFETLAKNWEVFPEDASSPVDQADRDRALQRRPRFPARQPNSQLVMGLADEQSQKSESTPPFLVDLNSCVLCDRCIRSCSEVRDFNVIGRSGKGDQTRIAFDLADKSMSESSCRSCGECMKACPTGAISFQRLVFQEELKRNTSGRTRVVEIDELHGHPLFRRLSHAFLAWNKGAVMRRDVEPGEAFAVYGEFGNTAFILEEGSFAITTESGMKIAELKADKEVIVGEMSPLSHGKRNANIVALSKGRVIEMKRNVLAELQRIPDVRHRVEQLYAKRALENLFKKGQSSGGASSTGATSFWSKLGRGLSRHKPPVSIFAGIADDRLIQDLSPFAVLLQAEPGQIICSQGEDVFPPEVPGRVSEDPPGLFIIRRGFIRVLTPFGSFLKREGEYFGELALVLGSWPEARVKYPQNLGAQGKRGATCVALDNVELLTFPARKFINVMERSENRAALDSLRVRCEKIVRGEA